MGGYFQSMNIVKKGLVRLLRTSGMGHEILNLYLNRKTLKKIGWLKSAERKIPLDENGEAIPWYTYSFIFFLKERINGEMRVFEYGSGNSTRWWAKYVESVVSCEHDANWYQSLRTQLPSNVEYHLIPLEYGGEYSEHIKNYREEFDVVVIDGRDRVNCAKNTVEALKESGVVIWDNSDRIQYQDGMLYLEKKGFKQITFYGHGPVSPKRWSTSVFYRPGNCLGI